MQSALHRKPALIPIRCDMLYFSDPTPTKSLQRTATRLSGDPTSKDLRETITVLL